MDRTRLPLTVALLACAALLAACEPMEEEEDLDPSFRGCLTVKGAADGPVPTGANCAGCNVTDDDKAVDKNSSTYALLSMPSGQFGTATLRVNAPTVYDADAGTAVYVGMLESIQYGPSTGVSIKLRTYLGSTLAEEFVVKAGSGSASADVENPTRESFLTTQDWDAVELEFTRTGGTGTVAARVHEFCGTSQ